jgi:HAD superfamily hydrolase (TIGR01549 family)
MVLAAEQLEIKPSNGSVPFEVIAFDCDGVLFDSKEANVRFYGHILEHIGRPPVGTEQREFIHMHPVRESLRYLVGNGPAFESAYKYAQSIDFEQFNACLIPEPGLVDLLKETQAYYYTALATNRTVSTRQVLAHFHIEQYFDLVVSASDVSFPKPHPEIMETIMDNFKVAPEQVLFVGDSRVDEALAVATGVFFVAYKNPDLHADLHISHFRELQPVLFSDNNKVKRALEV